MFSCLFNHAGRFLFPSLADSNVFGVRFLFYSTARSSDRRCPDGGAVRAQVRGSPLRSQRAGSAASPAARPKEGEACRSCSSPLGALRPSSWYVQRLRNSSLDTAVTETAPRPLPLSRCSKSSKLGLEADPGATCCPTLLGDGSIKEQSCFATHLALLCRLPLSSPLVFQLQPDILEIWVRDT